MPGHYGILFIAGRSSSLDLAADQRNIAKINRLYCPEGTVFLQNLMVGMA